MRTAVSGFLFARKLHYLMDNGKMKYVLANGTGPMSDKFSRNFRHFLWMDKVIYMIDDIAAHKPGISNGFGTITVRP